MEDRSLTPLPELIKAAEAAERVKAGHVENAHATQRAGHYVVSAGLLAVTFGPGLVERADTLVRDAVFPSMEAMQSAGEVRIAGVSVVLLGILFQLIGNSRHAAAAKLPGYNDIRYPVWSRIRRSRDENR